MRRDSAPRREAREGATAVAGGGPDGGNIAGAVTSKWSKGSGGPAGDECYNMVAHALRGEGFDASEDGTGRGTPLVPVSVALRGRDGGATAEIGDDCAFTLRASGGGGDKPHVLAFDTTQITSATNRCNQKAGDPCHPLAAGAHAPAVAFMADDYATGSFSEVDVAGPLTTSADRSRSAPIAFSAKDHGADAGELAPTLRAMGHAGSHANGGGQVAVAFQSSQSGVREGETHATLDANNGSRRHNGVVQGMAVRRLTPRECERLQGFPDDYTLIPWRIWQQAQRKGASYEALLAERGMKLREPAGEECPDGPRYKALGNSWAVPCARWIGERIDEQFRVPLP